MLPDDVVRRIIREHDDGLTLAKIADGLTADGVPTARGGARWYGSSVQSVLAGQDAARLREQATTATSWRPNRRATRASASGRAAGA